MSVVCFVSCGAFRVWLSKTDLTSYQGRSSCFVVFVRRLSSANYRLACWFALLLFFLLFFFGGGGWGGRGGCNSVVSFSFGVMGGGGGEDTWGVGEETERRGRGEGRDIHGLDIKDRIFSK